MKVKDKYLRDLAKEFELELSYQEWLRDNFSEPSSKELDLMEENFCTSSAVSNQIITHKALNNIDYNNPRGA